MNELTIWKLDIAIWEAGNPVFRQKRGVFRPGAALTIKLSGQKETVREFIRAGRAEVRQRREPRERVFNAKP